MFIDFQRSTKTQNKSEIHKNSKYRSHRYASKDIDHD